MQSKWFSLKPQALALRRKGKSLRDIEKNLKIPKSTLSGWLKDVILTEEQLLNLKANHIKSFDIARKQAVLWHNMQKEMRIKIAHEQAVETLDLIDTNDTTIQELALAMLYLGEGIKTKSGLGLGNSDPLVLKFFVALILKNYKIDISEIKCVLHLRADQDANVMTEYWSKQLNLPKENFNKPSHDLRTKDRPTFANYYGVCVITCGNIAVQRKLIYLSRQYCERITK
jgi:hypothetical protein